MPTIGSAQKSLSAWHQALAVATGGKVFTTHECSWAWQPARRRLVLLFPENATEAGLRPGLAEGSRLGARRIDAWINSGAGGNGLHQAGFRDASQISWHAGTPSPQWERWNGRVRLGIDVPEAKGADALELKVANLWRDPQAAGLTAGHAALRRVEHASARTLEGALVGRGFAQQSIGGEVALYGLAVSGDYRRQGAGTALLHALAHGMTNPLALEQGVDPELIAAGSPGSAEFFEASGMRLLGRGRHMVLR